MSSANGNSFYFFLFNVCAFFPFSCIVLSRTFSTMLKMVMGVEILALFLMLGGKHSVFNYDVSCRFFVEVL